MATDHPVPAASPVLLPGMPGSYGSRHYRRAYSSIILVLDGITTLIGLGVLFLVFTWATTPGDYEVTLHVTFGALIATLGFFRAVMGYGDWWPEVPLFVLGLFVFLLPHWFSMGWDPRYTNAHLAAGGAVMAISVISAIITIIENKRTART